MLEQHGGAAVQFRHQGIPSGITEVGAVHVAEQHHPIGPELIEGIAGLGDRPLQIRQGEGGEKPKRPGWRCTTSAA
jgi:hypothetical protein